ncbi:MAG: SgcJ/EcaC family oxidoreductase [Bacteroidota bacterium]
MDKKVAKPEDIPRLFAEAWNKRDADNIASLFIEDAEFVNVVGLWWHNREDIRKAHDYGLKTIFSESVIEVRRIKVRMLNDSIAIVHARMRLSGQTAHDGVTAPGVRMNIFSFVVQKAMDGWVCISAHNTDIVPGAETNIVDAGGKIKPTDYRR